MANCAIDVTDPGWYRFLRDQQDLSEVNFWSPGGRIYRLDQNTPILFKLRGSRPHFIAGVGWFRQSTQLPLLTTWEYFSISNGAPSCEKFREIVNGIRRDDNPNPRIGCMILLHPIFFKEEDWIRLEGWEMRGGARINFDSEDGGMGHTSGHRSPSGFPLGT